RFAGPGWFDRLGRLDRRTGRRQALFTPQRDDGLAGFLFDLADAIFELQAVLGDVARRQWGRDGAQLSDQGRTRLLVDGPPGRPIILRQRRDGAAQQLLVVRHWLVGTHNCSDTL